MLQELTDERISSDVDAWIEEVFRGSDRAGDGGGRNGLSVQESYRAPEILPPARQVRKRQRDRRLANLPIGEVWHAIDAAVHLQQRWGGGWRCWVCHRWSASQLTTRCENSVPVSMSYVPGTVQARPFTWDRWRLVGPLATRRGEHER